MGSEQADSLIRIMQQAAFYDHPVDHVELIETHISWVFLAGDFAYKVKKPVDFGFLDFSTLARRKHCCEEELRLNRRFAPQLEPQLVAIGGTSAAPRLNTEPACEYAVKMRRFDQAAQLDRMLSAGRLTIPIIECFAAYVAQLHQQAPVAAAQQPFGTPQAAFDPVMENFRQISPLLPAAETQQLTQLEHWSCNRWQASIRTFQQRKKNGFIRECHGDLHLANMAWVDEQPLLFDAIEFNENLRWIDIISDIAFLTMDLDDRGQEGLGWRFLNRYLQETGDYTGLQLLDYYQSYRAMVRAKVLCLRLAQANISPSERQEDLRRYHSYLALANSYTKPRPRFLLITHGLSGSGKTTCARQLADRCGALHLQSDRERKRLFGLGPMEQSGSPVDGGIYSRDAFAATYQRLCEFAEEILESGYPVIVDATFLQSAQRSLMRDLARRQRVPLVILDFPVAEQELRRRLQARATAGEVSEANLQVLELQLAKQQVLTAEEKSAATVLSADASATELGHRIKHLLATKNQRG